MAEIVFLLDLYASKEYNIRNINHMQSTFTIPAGRPVLPLKVCLVDYRLVIPLYFHFKYFLTALGF